MIKRSVLFVIILLCPALYSGAQQRLENGRIAVSIDKDGRLTEMRNILTGTDYAGGDAMWRLYFDTPDQREIQVDGAHQAAQVALDGGSIVISYESLKADSRFEGALNVSLTLTVSLEEDKVRFASAIVNNEPHTIVRELQYPLLGDIPMPEDWNLLTTKGGGQLIEDVRARIAAEGIKNPYMSPDQYYRQMPLEYPRGAVASNCFAILSQEEGLYFGSHDDTFANTGHGLRVYPSAKGVFDRLECGIYKYPNCVYGKSWECSANVVAPYSGSWTETSRLYRKWVDSSWWDRRTPPQWVQEMKSWQRIIFKHQYGEYFFKYPDLPGRILDVEKSVDSDAVLIFGWWEKGMDNSNPDYVADPSQGGDQALKEAIAEYQDKGGKAALYFNGKLIDKESDFYRSGAASGITFKDKSGSECVENYKFTSFGSYLGKYGFRNFTVADTGNPLWQKMMLSWADYAHSMGAASVFYDQMGSIEHSALNWNTSGEFPIPDLNTLATKANAMKLCRDHVMELSPDMAIGSEHITDVLCMYVDYSHGDGLLSMIDWFRYTFPELILSDRCIRDDTDIERRVNLTVLKGLRNDIEIYRCRGLIDETPKYQAYLAKVNALKDKYKDLLLKGRFCFRDFFTCGNPKVEARSFVNGDRMAIVLTSEEDRTQETVLNVPGYRFIEASTIGNVNVSGKGEELSIGKHGLAVLVFEKDVDNLRGLYHTYSAPEIADTPAPKGYKPVYISHYGRHGSRYHLSAAIVRQGRDSLRAAAQRGTITPLGAKVLASLEEQYSASEGHWGDLSARGALEHQAIAGRMLERFPGVFKGKRQIDAAATIRKRCQESMDAALGVFQKANPDLKITSEWGKETTEYLKNEYLLPEAQAWYGPRLDSAILACRDWKPVINRLYTDCRGTDMAQMKLALWIWHCWAEMPCLGMESFDILQWLSYEELQNLGRWYDMHIPMKCLRSDIFLEKRIESQRCLLDDMVSRADAALAGGKAAASLRYGHDANLAPLMALMRVKGFEGVYVLKDRPDPRWPGATMIPMGSNVQIIFYKGGKKDPVLVKILYNEQEVCVAGLEGGPYYEWDTLKRFWGYDNNPREAVLNAPEGYATALIQHAIDSLSTLGGGRVSLQKGTYLVTPLELKSGINLHLEEGAVLLASPKLEDYPDRPATRHFDTEALPRWRNIALIWADEARDISITGKGVIDGNGTFHIREKQGPNGNGWPFERIAPARESLPRMVFFAGCTNVWVQDVTMTNQPAGWGYWVHDCDYVRFKDCTIMNDVRYPNNDGIHVNCSRDVFISGCHIEAGDDATVIRANSRSLRENKACERVVITDCDLRSWSSAVRIGWNFDGAMRDCALTHLRIWDSSNGIGCYQPLFKYVVNSNDYGRESTLVEDFWCSDISMDQVYGNPVYFKAPDAVFRDIRFKNVSARALAAPYIWEVDLGNILFKDCRFEICSPEAFPGNPKQHGYVLNAVVTLFTR